jgi:hypothetical protein
MNRGYHMAPSAIAIPVKSGGNQKWELAVASWGQYRIANRPVRFRWAQENAPTLQRHCLIVGWAQLYRAHQKRCQFRNDDRLPCGCRLIAFNRSQPYLE